MALDLSMFLKALRSDADFAQCRRDLALALEQIQTHVNNGFDQVGISSNQKVSPPDPIENLDVQANNGTVQVNLTHNAPIRKNIRYFVEASTDASFSKPHVFDLGSSRSLFTQLPAKDADTNDLNWHFRAYAQYQGSDASAKTNFGETFSPTPVSVGGSSQFTPTDSTGSGTAAPDGQQGGQGLGTVVQRMPLGTKRGVAIES